VSLKPAAAHLSLMIRKMEDTLGVALFDRTSRHVALTTAGRELLPGVQRLIDELEATFDAVTESTAPIGGSVSVASIPSVSASVLPRIIAAFEKSRPRVHVVLHDAMTESHRMLQMLRAGEFDCAVGTPQPEDADLEFMPWFEDAMNVVVPLSHHLAGRRRVRWPEIAVLPIIGTSYNSHVRRLMDSAFASHGVSVRPRAEVSLVPTALGLVDAGIGVAVLPDTAVQNVAALNLRAIPLVEPVVRRSLGFVYRSASSLPPLAKEFIAFAAASAP
jgi:LysR family transcriptional regulator, carnitine catabolism transcriptional activator